MNGLYIMHLSTHLLVTYIENSDIISTFKVSHYVYVHCLLTKAAKNSSLQEYSLLTIKNININPKSMAKSEKILN